MARRLLESLRDEPATLIFYEAPHRIVESLSDIAAVMPARQVVAARELGPPGLSRNLPS